MDKTTFKDKELGDEMNEKFISVKWDAESKEYKELAKKYEVHSYPTFLYFSSNGDLLKKVSGYKNVTDLRGINSSYLGFLDSPDLLNKVNRISELDVKETTSLLSELRGFEVPEKKIVFQYFLSLVNNNPDSWKEHFELIVDNASSEDSISFFQKIVTNHPSINVTSLADMEKLKQQAAVNSKLTGKINNKMIHFKKQKEFDSYVELSLLLNELSKKSKMAVNPLMLSQKHDTNLLEYYRYNKMKTEYATLADKIVVEQILVNKVEDVKKQDEFAIKQMALLKKQYPETSLVLKNKDKVQKYCMDHVMSTMHSNKLSGICFSMLKLYDDKEQLEKAENWSLKSIEYLPLPNYYLTTAKIQQKLGKKKEASEIVKIGLKSKLLDDKTEQKLKKIADSL